jgi:RNA polymerase sigma-70 factor (ECF subfamily)
MAETFARAWNRRAHFAAESPDALPWLYGIARNVILESVRRARLERGATESLGIDLMLRRGPSDVLPDESWLDGLDDALNDLPDGQRSAIALRYTDDLSYDEIARRLGTSAVGARTRVSRGVDALRRHFQAL